MENSSCYIQFPHLLPSLYWNGVVLFIQLFSSSFVFRNVFSFFHPLHDPPLPARGLKDNKDDCVAIMWDTQFNHIHKKRVKSKSLLIFWSYNTFYNSSLDKVLSLSNESDFRCFETQKKHDKGITREENSLRFSALRILSNIPYFSRSGIPELKDRVEKPSYGLWHRKTDLSETMTSQPIFCKSGFLMKIKVPSDATHKFHLYLITLKFPSYATRESQFH